MHAEGAELKASVAPGLASRPLRRYLRSREGTLLVFALVPPIIWAEVVLSRIEGAASAFPFLASTLAAVLAAACGWMWPALVLIAAVVLASDYWVLGPGELLRVASPFEAAAVALFAGGSTGVCLLVHRLRIGIVGERKACTRARGEAGQATRRAELVSALGRTRSAGAVIDAALQEPLHALRADAAMLLLVREDATVAKVARAIGYEPDPSTAAAASLSEPGPIRDAVARLARVALESPAARAAEYGEAPDRIAEAGYSASITLPLLVARRPVAVIRLDFRETRAFTTADDEYLDILGSHAAHALERAWEEESNQRARVEAEGFRARADEELARRQATEQALRASETVYRGLAARTARLHELTAALSEAVTTHAVATAIMQHATVVVGATAADVWLLTQDGTGFEALSASSEATYAPRRLVSEPGVLEADVIDTGRPIYIKSWEASQERYWRSASAAADSAYASSSALPLLVHAAAAGVLRFDFSVPVNFDREYQGLLMSVAQHCSQALDRARLYESAQRARADAETASRLKDEFLSIVSHELRTPLNAVLGWASMLQKTSIDSPLAQRAVQSVHDNATRQARLIDDLLDLSRISAGRATLDLQDIDLPTLVGGVVESLIPVAASSAIDLQVSPIPQAVISGDRRRLEQVLFNLIGNALKFTRSGGWIRIEAYVRNGAAHASVQDSGIGIDPEFLPHVFERFRQADSTSTRTYSGLGLGLAIAKQLVEAHGGCITVESAGRGHGATFTVQLPLRPAPRLRSPAPAPAARAAAAIDSRLDGIRVLVVDDEADAREILTLALSERGACVVAAQTAADAFGRLASEPFDVLVSDIAMPGEDGCSLLRRVRACGDRRMALIPAAAVTAHVREEERRDVLVAGFQVHLPKPIEPVDVVRVVGELARGAVS